MRLSNFLSGDDHATLLRWALSNEENYVPSGVGYGSDSPKGTANTRLRKSQSLPTLGPCLDILKAAIEPRLAEFSAALGLSYREFQRFEAELVAHNDGAFFKPHIDTGAPNSREANRIISAVYYFHNTPKAFSGGALRMYDMTKPGQFVDYEPEDNSLLLFPAFVPHEVREVFCPSYAFADSRFAINCWVHRPV